MKPTMLCCIALATGLSFVTLSGCTTQNASTNNHPTSHLSNHSTSNSLRVQNASSTGTANNTSAPSPAPQLTLEQIQFADNQITFILTHGDMQHTYVNPHITSDRKQFIVTLKHVGHGDYPIDVATPVDANWATSYQLTQKGDNLTVTVDLRPGFSTVTPLIGGGTQIAFTIH
ncbi:hypothetical protein [Alicyclobacillus acidoterrestris]|uniref:Uncharacterized protein n=1 Tax=Alicyclobacillus acidoterrestris (strain ATCC 49025 / DSM 3922 / CIP 106132 / NCIMB 13137 / GD3B) TaxID=1356854 RepID=T0DCJ5_ALIAG|nr:hypothetical protein [Alicyclobacillus acidoterrestris]EPZ49057.1 hypothetical protein N007_04245 [Alicyclobacillus acidoterrestris ATCC 49025]UNO47578.1 hypothetical protein K1I37_12805 [Alicyclobacillus acidoterrestris]